MTDIYRIKIFLVRRTPSRICHYCSQFVTENAITKNRTTSQNIEKKTTKKLSHCDEAGERLIAP